MAAYPSMSQYRVTLHGYLADAATGEKLVAASVSIPEDKIGTQANAYGYYSITLRPGTYRLLFSYSGYDPLDTIIVLQQNLAFDARLYNSEKSLEGVIVENAPLRVLERQTQMSSFKISRSLIRSVPALLGESDMLRTAQLMPGIKAGNDGLSGIFVRGGGPDQNLFLVDGVPVYNPTHMLGLFSSFNPDAIKSVEIIEGGFPARYGGRLSSVVDIKLKDGNKNRFQGEASTGLMSSKLSLEGPLKKGHSSFFLSGRATHFGLLVKPLIKSGVGVDAGYFFYDLNAKANLVLSPKDYIYFSAYAGKDAFSAGNLSVSGDQDTTSGSFRWGNVLGTIRWNHEFGKKSFGNLLLSYTRFRFGDQSKTINNNIFGTEIFEQQFHSSINDLGMKYDVDINPSPAHSIRLGAGLIRHHFEPGVSQRVINNPVQRSDTTIQAKSIITKDVDLYAEDEWRVSPTWNIQAGIHTTANQVGTTRYFSIQPRLAFRNMLSEQIHIKFSAVWMEQYIHLLTNSGIGLPTDLWVPATSKLPPQKAFQAAMGLSWMPGNQYGFTWEIYYKRLRNVIEYSEGANYLSTAADWELKTETGEGWNYGTEFFAEKKLGRFSGFVGYSLSWAQRKFERLNNGNPFYFKFDRRHDLKAVVLYKPSMNKEFSAGWQFCSGNPTTLPVGFYRDNQFGLIDIYRSRNNFRMAPYHRLDLSCRLIKKKKHIERSWLFSVYNLYNRLNPFFILRNSKYDNSSAQYISSFEQVTLMPVIPSVSYQLRF